VALCLLQRCEGIRMHVFGNVQKGWKCDRFCVKELSYVPHNVAKSLVRTNNKGATLKTKLQHASRAGSGHPPTTLPSPWRRLALVVASPAGQCLVPPSAAQPPMAATAGERSPGPRASVKRPRPRPKGRELDADFPTLGFGVLETERGPSSHDNLHSKCA
jgi:hypothetical protein